LGANQQLLVPASHKPLQLYPILSHGLFSLKETGSEAGEAPAAAHAAVTVMAVNLLARQGTCFKPGLLVADLFDGRFYGETPVSAFFLAGSAKSYRGFGMRI
jgi:hypothetical protein